MQNRFTIFLLFTLITFQSLLAEENQNTKKQTDFKVKLSGYVKSDFFYDSRQTVSARGGQFLLWPAPKDLDANGNDINDKSSLNFLSIQSRLRVNVSGPMVLGAKPTALIEGDFFATSNTQSGHFRLRHAIIKLNWEKTELLTGQYWNPFFVTDCYPNTVSFNTGVPSQGLARNPQIRLTHEVGGLKLIAAALTQSDFASLGPIGKSSTYLRNSVVPELQAQIHYGFSNVLFGGGIAYKSIVPRLSSVVDGNVYQVSERVSGISGLGFIKITTKPLTLKFQGRYGENNTDILSIGGYAVKSFTNQETQERLYTPLTNSSLWGDIETNGKRLQFGLFAGMTTNHGTKEAMEGDFASNPIIYGFGHNIKSLYRISPRVVYNYNKLRLGLETELTSASYGKNHNRYWQAQTFDRVENYRVLLAAFYFF